MIGKIKYDKILKGKFAAAKFEYTIERFRLVGEKAVN